MWFFAQKLSHHGVAGKSCSGRRQVLDLNVMFVTLRAEESLRYARYCRRAIAQATGLRYQKLGLFIAKNFAKWNNGTHERRFSRPQGRWRVFMDCWGLQLGLFFLVKGYNHNKLG